MTRSPLEDPNDARDGRQITPAGQRNVGPLVEALRDRLPAKGRVLEVASGTGQHAAAFAAAFPDLAWMPSDVDPFGRESIAAWQRASGLTNLSEPLALDVAAPWPVAPGSVQAVLTVNLLHLIPEPFVARLFESARAALGDGGRVIVYGPFLRGSAYASDGDRAFDASLRARDPAIGYKSVDAVSVMARAAGLTPIAQDAMPANNLLLTFAVPQGFLEVKPSSPSSMRAAAWFVVEF